MYYPDEIIEEVRIRNDIIDVIGDYVQLQPKGSSHFGLCPFHHEKTPSFSVSKDKQMYYCFGCGAGGNVISFVMAYENYTFVEAVKYLAERAHVDLPEPEVSESMRKAINYRQRLYEANRQAARYYYVVLRKDIGDRAREYLTKRELSADTIKQFGLGYSTMFKNDLYNHLKKKEFSDQELMDSGLLLENKYQPGHYYDRFFNRVMFPIMDVHNHIIAFGGRVLGEGEPKYLNSPETTLFDKSRNLYGLNLAKKAKVAYLILVEGYMDVIALHQAGFNSAVASLGTAFTTGHGSLMKRYVDEVILSFDSDEAGVRATLRAIHILRGAGLRVRVLKMDNAKDPDEYIKKNGAESYQRQIDKAMPSFMFEIERLSMDYDLNDPQYKTEFSRRVAKKLLEIPEKLERDNYIQAIVKAYQMPEDGIYELLRKFAQEQGLVAKRQDTTDSRRSNRLQENSNKENGQTKAEKLLLAMMVSEKRLFDLVTDYIQPEYFINETLHQVASIVYDLYKNEDEIEPGKVLNHFTEVKDHQMIAGIFSEDVQIANPYDLEKELNSIVRKIKGAYLDQKLVSTKDPQGLMQLINEKKKLQNMQIRLEEIKRRD